MTIEKVSIEVIYLSFRDMFELLFFIKNNKYLIVKQKIYPEHQKGHFLGTLVRSLINICRLNVV